MKIEEIRTQNLSGSSQCVVPRMFFNEIVSITKAEEFDNLLIDYEFFKDFLKKKPEGFFFFLGVNNCKHSTLTVINRLYRDFDFFIRVEYVCNSEKHELVLKTIRDFVWEDNSLLQEIQTAEKPWKEN